MAKYEPTPKRGTYDGAVLEAAPEVPHGVIFVTTVEVHSEQVPLSPHGALTPGQAVDNFVNSLRNDGKRVKSFSFEFPPEFWDGPA